MQQFELFNLHLCKISFAKSLTLFLLLTCFVLNGQKVTSFVIDSKLGFNFEFGYAWDNENVSLIHTEDKSSEQLTYSNQGDLIKKETSELKYSQSIFVGIVNDRIIHLTYNERQSPGIYLYKSGPSEPLNRYF